MNIEAIIQAAARVSGCQPPEITSKSRAVELVRIRQAIARIAHQNGCSIGQIAKALNRDTSTIYYAIYYATPVSPDYLSNICKEITKQELLSEIKSGLQEILLLIEG